MRYSQRRAKKGWGLGLRRVMCLGETVRKEKRGDEARETWTLSEPPFPAPLSPFSLSAELMTHCWNEREPRGEYCEEWRSAAAELLQRRLRPAGSGEDVRLWSSTLLHYIAFTSFPRLVLAHEPDVWHQLQSFNVEFTDQTFGYKINFVTYSCLRIG